MTFIITYHTSSAIRYIQTRIIYNVPYWHLIYPVHYYYLNLFYFIFPGKKSLYTFFYILHASNKKYFPEFTLNANGNIHLPIDINYYVYFKNTPIYKYEMS